MKRRKSLVVVLSALVAFSFLTAGCSKKEEAKASGPKADETIKLVYSSGFGESEVVNTYAKYFMDYVESKTAGKVKFTRYFSTLGTPDEQFGLLSSGSVDVGMAGQLIINNTIPIFGYISGQRGSVQAALDFQHKLNFENPESSKVLSSALAEKNVQLLTFLPTGVDAVISKNVIHSLSDLKGKKVGTSRMFADAFKSMGMIPLSIPPSDVYESLSRGVVDAVSFPLSVIEKLKLQELGKSLVVVNTYGAGQTLLVNTKSWEKLPLDVKQVFNDGIAATMSYASDFEAKNTEDVLNKFKQGGMTIRTVPQEETDKVYLSNYKLTMGIMEANAEKVGKSEDAKIIRKVCDELTFK
jgi:TRAP-type transport system periplasmic protein